LTDRFFFRSLGSRLCWS